jgi:hypothetical protein
MSQTENFPNGFDYSNGISPTKALAELKEGEKEAKVDRDLIKSLNDEKKKAVASNQTIKK